MAANQDVGAVVEANTKFGYDVYKWLSKASLEKSPTKPDNLLLCPLSVETVLALTLTGAKGATAEEMSTVLKLPNDPTKVSKGFLDLTTQLKSKDVIIKTANKVFVADDVKLTDEFKQTAVKYFDAETENVNMKDSSKTLGIINSWCAKKTENKITSILQDLDADTVSVLINAIYFNGKWEKIFKKTEYPMNFNLTEEESIQVPAIQRKGDYRYYEDESVQIVEIPYKGNEYSLVIALPRGHGLPVLEETFPSDYQSKLQSCEVNVTIPMFKIESEIDFTTILKDLGMQIAFSDAADFTGLIDPKSARGTVAISQVIQKCFIDVNEEGTEAAAVTAVKCRRRRCVDESACFIADHPFHFALVNVLLQIPIFIGDCNSIPSLDTTLENDSVCQEQFY